MKTRQYTWTSHGGWDFGEASVSAPQLVLALGAPGALEAGFRALQDRHPGAPVFACSTAGEIVGTRVLDDTIVATAVWLDSARVRGVQVPLASPDATAQAAEEIGRALAADDLAWVLVFSEGLEVNGSELVRGLARSLPAHTIVTGGLAADGPRFGRTLVGWDDAPAARRVAAVGLYGASLEVGAGSVGGWDAFGPDRVVTRAQGNVLYELDGEPALALYKKYLGVHAQGLPASALLFPLLLTTRPGAAGVVRTVLTVRESDSAMVFAGDVPEGARVRLMKANVDRLVDGASDAAARSTLPAGTGTSLAFLVSCVGRKLVLRQRVEEEVEAVSQILGRDATLAGFYSYGEISPLAPDERCALHNQTMTVTVIRERALAP